MNLFKISFFILCAHHLACTPPKEQSETKFKNQGARLGVMPNQIQDVSKVIPSNKISLDDLISGQVDGKTMTMIRNILDNRNVKDLGKVVKVSVDSKLKVFQNNEIIKNGILMSTDIQTFASAIRSNSSKYEDQISKVLDDQSLQVLNIEELSHEFIHRSSKDIPDFSQYVEKIGSLDETNRIVAMTVVKNVTLTAQIEFFYALLNHPRVKGNSDLEKRIKVEFDRKRNANIESGIKTYDPKWITKKEGLLDQLFPNTY